MEKLRFLQVIDFIENYSMTKKLISDFEQIASIIEDAMLCAMGRAREVEACVNDNQDGIEIRRMMA